MITTIVYTKLDSFADHINMKLLHIHTHISRKFVGLIIIFPDKYSQFTAGQASPALALTAALT